MNSIQRQATILFLFAILCFKKSSQAQNASAYSKEVQAKISEVEKKLGGWYEIEGKPKWTLVERMKYYHANGVSIAVIKDFKIDWAKGYGWADSAAQKPVTIQTLFQAGSISKSLNAVGILKLVQEKKLDLYTDINRYLTSWKFPYDSASKGEKITIANLLSHTAGLSVHGFAGYEKDSAVPTLVEVLNGKAPANSAPVRSLFKPSLKYQYSGGGTTISQLIVQDVTREPYEKYMWENVLRPLEMTFSSYTQPPVNNKELLATAYYDDSEPVNGKYHIYPEKAAAGLWTNPTDLAKYIIETQLALQGKSAKVLNQATTKLRLTPYIDSAVALGVFIRKDSTQKYFGHDGVDEGFIANYYGSFEGGNGVVVMSNSYNTSLLKEIINSIASVYDWKDFYKPVIKKTVPVSDTLLQKYTGRYAFSPTFVVTITRDGNRLFTQATGQAIFEVFPTSQTRFFVKDFQAEMEFVKDNSGNIYKYLLYQNGKQYEAKRMQ